ncbi:hypothetical protein B566_EDAN016139, partial [Ephemera danica]
MSSCRIDRSFLLWLQDEQTSVHSCTSSELYLRTLLLSTPSRRVEHDESAEQAPPSRLTAPTAASRLLLPCPRRRRPSLTGLTLQPAPMHPTMTSKEAACPPGQKEQVEPVDLSVQREEGGSTTPPVLVSVPTPPSGTPVKPPLVLQVPRYSPQLAVSHPPPAPAVQQSVTPAIASLASQEHRLLQPGKQGEAPFSAMELISWYLEA